MATESPNGSDPELINHSTADVADESQGQPANDLPSDRPPPLRRQSTAGREKCWICLETKDEDPPSPPNPPTQWRSPCSCSLQAHEACLLDWVADQESPKSRNGGGRSGPTPDKILCPQCRSEIKIQRPRDLLVQLCRRIDKQYSRLVLPGVAGTIVGTLLAGCWAHGRLSTYLVFGYEHDRQIFNFAMNSRHRRDLTYAFIPLSLIFSRTKWADFVVPFGTITLLSTQLPDSLDGPFIAWDGPFWPALPSTVFALLPTLNSFYGWTYEKCFGELNRKWLDEIQPRREEGYEGQEENIPDILNEAEGMEEAGGDNAGVVLELELNLGQGGVNGDAGDGNAEAENNAQGGNGEHNQAQHNDNAGGHVHRLLGNDEFIDDTTSIGQQVVGSLILPAAASLAGEALKLLLPVSWISPRWNFYPASGRVGFFATKWGRSVAGGIAICVIKDMMVLYCRWRIAEAHKKRKIMNFDKSTKEYVPVR